MPSEQEERVLRAVGVVGLRVFTSLADMPEARTRAALSTALRENNMSLDNLRAVYYDVPPERLAATAIRLTDMNILTDVLIDLDGSLEDDLIKWFAYKYTPATAGDAFIDQ